MDKGIRPYCNALFLSTLPNRVNTREGNTAFRKNIIATCMEDFGITLASAATHYNHAFISAREIAKTNPDIAQLLVGLGRAEDKKGGRKPKIVAAPPAVVETATVSDVFDSNLLNNGDEMSGADEVAPQEAAVAPQEAAVAPQEAAVVKFKVRKVSDGTVVCEDLTEAEAAELIAKAAAAKKAKLEMVV